jgi:glycosyltransferase involved in cell wall biosynthesis
MFRAVIDATPLTPQPSGVGFHVLNLIQALAKLQVSTDFQLGVSFQPPLKQWLRGDFSVPPPLRDQADLTVIPWPVRLTNAVNAMPLRSPEWAGQYFEQTLGRPDILHGTNFSVYPRHRARTLLTIYDLTCLKYPHYVDGVARRYGDRLKHCLQWTDGILTISEHSKRDIVEYLNVKPDTVYVAYLASRYGDPGDHPTEASSPGSLKAGLAPPIPDPYILFVSTIEPRKNVIGLVQAFNQLKRTLDIPHHLVLVGRKGWNYQPIFAEMARSPWTEQIHHLDYLSDAAVAACYRHAAVFAFPSYYEGFGLPVLEAMTLGAPVVTAATSSLPEVAGDAAILVDPHDPASIAAGIAQVLTDPQLRATLVQRGKIRARQFSWETTALDTLKAYRELLS